MDRRKDAIGVNSALKLRSYNYALVSQHEYRSVCVAVINRYDQKKEAAEMTELAAKILTECNRNTRFFIVWVKDIEKLCDYLLKEV